MGQKENPTQCKKPSDKFGGLVWIGSQIALCGRGRIADRHILLRSISIKRGKVCTKIHLRFCAF